MQGVKVNQSKKKLKHLKLLSALLALLVIVITVISGQTILSAFADTYSITNVLTDLQKDKSFNMDDYPVNGNDYSLNVIQVAEGIDGNLYLYTYQPCQNTKYITATQLNMSLSETADGTKPYNLTIVSSSGVFCKYKVNGVTVSSDTERFYNITSIYRDWIDGKDSSSDNDNIINGVAFPVGKVWKATTTSNGVKYDMKRIDIVTIKPEQKYVGFVRYTNGFGYLVDYNCDSWYIAFDCDYLIDNLYEAEVEYSSRSYKTTYGWWGATSSTDYGEWTYGQQVTLTQDQSVNNELQGWGYGWVKPHEWKEIQSVAEFIETEDLKDETKTVLRDKQWVLRFVNTDYTKSGFSEGVSWTESGTQIADVAILRLKFEIGGTTYNLGVVDNKQTGDYTSPDNNPDKPEQNDKQTFWEYVWNCIIKLFSGTASGWEKFVAIGSIIGAVVVFAIAIAFLRWLKRCIFGKGD